MINEEDFEIYLGIKDDEEHQVEFEILSDPTGKITSAEGVEGYGKLFASRFNKLKQIMSDRPEAKRSKILNLSNQSQKMMMNYSVGISFR